MTLTIRTRISNAIQTLIPLDDKEKQDISNTLQWISHADEIFRTKKHATPPKHLVSYCVLVDKEYILLTDHKKAGFWAPTGGHVDPNEHPKACAIREINEELNITPDLLSRDPLFLTVMETVGDIVQRHIDVSLWYVFKGNKNKKIMFDKREFNDAQWFHIDNLPFDRIEPNLKRFICKYKTLQRGLPNSNEACNEEAINTALSCEMIR